MKTRLVVVDLALFVTCNALIAGLMALGMSGCKEAFKPVEPTDEAAKSAPISPGLSPDPARPLAPEARRIEAGLPGGAAPAVATPTRRATPSPRTPARPAGGELRHDERVRQPEPATPAASSPAAVRPSPTRIEAPRTVGPLAVADKAMATRMKNRTPQGIAESFPVSTGAVYAFIKVKNKGTKTMVVMVWKKDGVEKWRYSLRVGTSRGWRTWSKMRLNKRHVGSWTVEVRTLDDALLDTLAFTVEHG